MRHLGVAEVIGLQRRLVAATGGYHGILDLGSLESALAQPRMAFGGEDLYPTVVEKAAALGYALIKNHPVLDGNELVAHAAMESFLVLNGFELEAETGDQERVVVALADGEIDRSALEAWLRAHLRPRS